MYNPVARVDVKESEVRIFGTKKHFSDGSVNKACEVVLSKEGTTDNYARTTTDKFGNFELILVKENIIPGVYQLRYYGSGTSLRANTPYGDWEIVDLSSNILGIDINIPLVFDGVPSLEVIETDDLSELETDINEKFNTTAVFNFTNIILLQGKLGSINVFYKEYDAVSDYKELAKFDYDLTLENVAETSAVFKIKVPLLNKNLKYNFQCIFLNKAGTIAIDDAGEVITVTDLEVPFNGISDYSEMLEVRDLKIYYNNSFQNANNEFDIDISNQLTISFRNMYKYNIVEDFVKADGNTYSNVSLDFWRNISKYSIFVFVSETGELPETEYPISNSTKGVWYLFEEVKDQHLNYPVDTEAFNALIEKVSYNVVLNNLPLGKYICFWVGVSSSASFTSTSKIKDAKKGLFREE